MKQGVAKKNNNGVSKQHHEVSQHQAYSFPDNRAQFEVTKALVQLMKHGKQDAVQPDDRHEGSVTQAKFKKDGAWMDSVNNTTLTAKFGTTTRALWAALRDLNTDIDVSKGGSGGSFNFNTNTISLSADYMDSIKTYVDSDTKDGKLGQATASLTHEMSHAHDCLVRGESPQFEDRFTLDYVTSVLNTELRAWMKEARSARENKKDNEIDAGDDASKLICSWLAVHYTGNSCIDLDIYENSVIGRLKKYYNDNKPENYSKTLAEYIEKKPIILALLKEYAAVIRGKYTSGDNVLRNLNGVKSAMKKG